MAKKKNGADNILVSVILGASALFFALSLFGEKKKEEGK